MKNNKTLIISILGLISAMALSTTKNIIFAFLTAIFLIYFFYLKIKK